MAKFGVLCGALLLAALLTNDALAQYYIYKGDDGIQLFTDRKLKNLAGYKLLATVGRPTASKSCFAVNSPALERRARPYTAAIREYSRLYNIDDLMVKAIIMVESCFNRKAVSRAGAKGLMQLMPATARKMGVTHIFDATENVRGGARYFGMMMERFKDDIRLALAAYNAGPAAVDKYKGIPPYKETQGYVKRVLEIYGKLGGKVAEPKPVEDTDETEPTSPLGEIAKGLDSSVITIIE